VLDCGNFHLLCGISLEALCRGFKYSFDNLVKLVKNLLLGLMSHWSRST